MVVSISSSLSGACRSSGVRGIAHADGGDDGTDDEQCRGRPGRPMEAGQIERAPGDRRERGDREEPGDAGDGVVDRRRDARARSVGRRSRPNNRERLTLKCPATSR